MPAFFQRVSLPVARVETAVPACGACGLFRKCHTPKMKVAGQGRLGILIVAEVPSKEDDATGQLFAGQTGREFSRMLSVMGVDIKRDCYVTSSLICHTSSRAAVDDSKVTGYCLPNVVRAIKDHEPTVIILLGPAAVKSVIGWLWKSDNGGVEAWAGWQIPDRKTNAWICPTYNPAFVQGHKNPMYATELKRHVQAAVKLAKQSKRPYAEKMDPIPRDRVTVIVNPGEAAPIIRKIGRNPGGPVAFDYETTCLKPESKHANIYCCSLSNGVQTIAFPWQGSAAMAMADLIHDRNVLKIASNIKFEERWTWKHTGKRVGGWWWDTMLNAHLLDAREDITSIKFQSYARLGIGDYNSHVEWALSPAKVDEVKWGNNAPNQIKKLPLRDVLMYCGLDSLLEYEVAYHQRRELGIED